MPVHHEQDKIPTADSQRQKTGSYISGTCQGMKKGDAIHIIRSVKGSPKPAQVRKRDNTPKQLGAHRIPGYACAKNWRFLTAFPSL